MKKALDVAPIDVLQLYEDLDIGMKVMPQQHRAKATIENILHCTSELMEVIGIDELSTNIICDRANLTPPALYRYFPNRNAVIIEIAQRFLVQRYGLLVRWIHAGGIGDGSHDEAVKGLRLMAGAISDNLRETVAANELCKIIRALPALEPLRLKVREHSLNVMLAHLEGFGLAMPKDKARRVLGMLMEAYLVLLEFVHEDESDEAREEIAIACDMAASQLCLLIRPVDSASRMVAHG